MTIITLQEFGKPFVVLDGSKISAVTCFDIQERVDHRIPAGQHRFVVRVVCGGGVLDIGFDAADRSNWSRSYHVLVAALYREAGAPMSARVPPPVDNIAESSSRCRPHPPSIFADKKIRGGLWANC